ncbi:MAG: hypothetical protein KDA65_13110 [Planctomycetaceae bacterium]|nr:hypothetical protein [Planctomycetaceae bacterium]
MKPDRRVVNTALKSLIVIVVIACVTAIGFLTLSGRDEEQNLSGQNGGENYGDGRSKPFPSLEELLDQTKGGPPQPDWDYYFNKSPLDIKSIEFVGFQKYNEGKPLRFKITDKKYIKMFQQGMAPAFMLRPGTSGFSTMAINYSEDTDIRDAILLNTPEGQIVVGMSDSGFQLESVFSDDTTCFYSWILAKAVDDILFEKTGMRQGESRFNRVSGLWVYDIQKEDYNTITSSPAE